MLGGITTCVILIVVGSLVAINVRRFHKGHRYRFLPFVVRPENRVMKISGLRFTAVRAASDAKASIKACIRHPGFVASAVIPTALTTSVVFSMMCVVGALFLTRLDIPEPQNLLALSRQNSDGLRRPWPADAAERLAGRGAALAGYSGGTVLTVEANGEVRPRPIEAVSPTYFGVLGVQPAVGRAFRETDGPLSVVLSDAYWRRAFNASPSAVGTLIRIEGHAVTVVGVMPPGAIGLRVETDADIIAPLQLLRSVTGVDQASRPQYILARLDGSSKPAPLEAQWEAAWSSYEATAPPDERRESTTVRVESAQYGLSDSRIRLRDGLTVLVSLALALYVVGWVGFGGVMLTRGAARVDEFSVRASHGATGASLRSLVLIEAVALGVIIIVASIPAGYTLGRFFVDFVMSGPLPFTRSLWPSPGASLVLVGVSLCAACTSVVPTIVAMRPCAVTPTTISGRRVIRVNRHVGTVSTSVQLGLALTVSLWAMAFAIQWHSLISVDHGANTDRLYWTRLAKYPGAELPADSRAYYAQLLEGLGQTEGAYAMRFPTVAASRPGFVSAGRPGSAERVRAITDSVSPGFFSVAGIPILSGRSFTWSDGQDGTIPCIVSSATGRAVFRDTDVVGRSIAVEALDKEETCQIVGVVQSATPGDIRLSGSNMVYLPLFRGGSKVSNPVLVVRSEAEALSDHALSSYIQRYGQHYVWNVRKVGETIVQGIVSERVAVYLAFCASVMALLVAAVGLYSATSLSIRLDRRQLAVRAALGASRAHLVGLVSKPIGFVVTTGTLAAVSAFVLSTRGLARVVSPPKISSVEGGLTVMASLAVVLVAAIVPVWRAANTPVSGVMRDE